MESTASTPFVVSPQRLAHAFANVPDPRRLPSVRYPLAAILTLAVSALLANHLSVLAIAEWGERQAPDHQRKLGFVEDKTPWRKDVTFGEDASLIHAGQGPLVMTALRDATVSLLHDHGITRVVSQFRAFSQDQAIALVLDPLIAHA